MSEMQRAREKQTKHVQREPLLLSLAEPQPQPSSSVCMPKFRLGPTGNQADRPECPKVKMTHSTDLNNTNSQEIWGGAHKHDFHNMTS